MKFNKAKKDNHYRYAVSNRKIAAYHRKIKQTQAAYPLFAEQVAAEFAPVEQVMAERQAASIAQEQAWRDHRAMQWKSARARLRNSHCREAVYYQWQNSRWMTYDPVYLLDRVWAAENPGIHHIPAWMWQKQSIHNGIYWQRKKRIHLRPTGLQSPLPRCGLCHRLGQCLLQ